MNVWLALNERLGTVAVVDIPIDDQDPMQAVLVSRIVRGDGNVTEQAEPHCTIVYGVMSGRTHGGKAPWIDAGRREINCCENAAGSSNSSVPGPTARHRIRVKASSTLLRDYSDRADVGRIVRKSQLFDGGVPPLDVLDIMKCFWIVPKRPRDGAETPDVLGVSPSGVVSAAVAVRDERSPHCAGAYSTGRRRRSVMTKIDPFLAAVDEIGAFSSRTSKPFSLTTYSFALLPSG